MKIGRVIHQQVVQLRWPFLASLGLIMVLPIEEATINLKDGEAFYAAGTVIASIMIAPLLTGLIACANVQADLNEKRYIFWRSKPVDVKTFMTLKFLVGLVIALFVLAVPITFGLMGDIYYKRSFNNVIAAKPIFLNILMISVMAYSLCFLCNALIRKTARAWLIGIALACLLLLIPFILPLHLKDVVSEFLNIISAVYVSIMLGTFLVAFILSLIAVSRNWHLQTNLKGLLWTGASLIFLLMLLFTRQVANIKVLDEIQTPETFRGFINKTGNQIISPHFGQIQIQNDQIKLYPIDAVSAKELFKQRGEKIKSFFSEEAGLRLDHNIYRSSFYTFDDQVYMLSVEGYFIENKRNGKNTFSRKYEKLYACIWKIDDDFDIPISKFDISDLRGNNDYPNIAARKIDDKLILVVNESFIVATIGDGGQIKILDKKLNVIKHYYSYSSRGDIVIPLIPIEQLGIKERIKFSIDINNQIYSNHDRNNSIVDSIDDNILFCQLSEKGISRYEVERWDDKSIYCTLQDGRPFTLLEQLFSQVHDWSQCFIQNGKLYVYGRQKLLIFDIRSKHIRKLGHYERISKHFEINNLEVLDNGNVLFCADSGMRRYQNGHSSTIYSLYLLKNPQ